MADETFRPHKKPISDESISETTPADIDSEISNSQNSESGVRITGNVPEAFKKAVMQQRGAKETPGRQPEMRVTGSSKLEELIAGISSKGNIIYEKIIA